MVIRRQNGGTGASRGCGSQSRLRLNVGIGNDRRFRSGSGLHGNGRGTGSYAGFRSFFDAHQALIRNLPAEVTVFATLLEMLLEEDGTAGIGDKNAGSGQKNIASAVLHFHTTPEKG